MKTSTFLPCSQLHIDVAVTDTGAHIDIQHPHFRHRGVAVPKSVLQDRDKLIDECKYIVNTLKLPCSPSDFLMCLYYPRNHFRIQTP